MYEWHKKEAPLLGLEGSGGGLGFLAGRGGPVDPGVISGVFNSSGDGYSGGSQSGVTCNGNTYPSFTARPPNQTQVDGMIGAWMNCKSYAGDGVNPQTYGAGTFWGRSGNNLTLTFTDFQPNQEMGIFLYTTGSRTITFSGLFSATDNDKNYDYRYFTVNSSGGGTLTCAFNPTGDPPYIYWCGPRYNNPGY